MPRYPVTQAARGPVADLLASGRLLDAAAAEVAAAAQPDASGWHADRWALARWAGVAGAYGLACALLGYGLFQLYFGAAAGERGCDAHAEVQSRTWIHWFVGSAPVWARNAMVAALAVQGFRRGSGIRAQGQSLVQAMFVGGAGAGDGGADLAGWLSVVGGHADGRRQATWAEAREARGLKENTARWLAVAKLVLWHWSQPVAYVWLLWNYRCYVAKLGETQQYLAAAVVATREVIYLASTLLAAQFCPVFMLLDLKTVWNEAVSPLQAVTRIAMYVLCPHTYVALALSNRFRRWTRCFLCLAFFQVLADVSSCYALANLMASSIEVQTATAAGNGSSVLPPPECALRPSASAEFAATCATFATEAKCGLLQDMCEWTGAASTADIGPLEIGYTITSFGFLLFFGPLSIASSLNAARDDKHGSHWVLRAVKGALGFALLAAWVYIMVLMGWLLAGGNPFCSRLLLADPCNGHGECYGAGQCHCSAGFGPDSKLSGTDMCSCSIGHIDGREGHCKHPTGCDEPDCAHGTCVANGGDHSCACPDGWSGGTCDHPTGCDSDPCNHGGTCTANGGDHSCVCPGYWTGDDCDLCNLMLTWNQTHPAPPANGQPCSVPSPTDFTYPDNYAVTPMRASVGFQPAADAWTQGKDSLAAAGDVTYYGGVLLPDGRVVLVPDYADRVGLYDPSTDAWTQGKDSLAAAGAKKYRGGVLLPDGRVVLVPSSADRVGLYDPSTDAWTQGKDSLAAAGANKYRGGVLLIRFWPMDLGIYTRVHYLDIRYIRTSTNSGHGIGV